ncbi:MAG: serine/threonine protein kinase [Magnetococcales bacterium]|nr:serine/threonine protein kinase [Magnetococcales bacterium]
MASQTQKPLPNGVLLNECEILEVLGIGAFGITYLAYDKPLDRKVAIKEFFPRDFAQRDENNNVVAKKDSDPELFNWGLERFFLEGRTLAKFKHVSIVGVVRIFRDMGTAYLIMDYEPGISLGKHIKQRKKSLFQSRNDYSKEELFKIIRYLSGGLKAIHETGIIHRDIKPENIIIRDNGVPVLLDFGAARQAMLEKNPKLTVMATPAYAPPEQFLQEGQQGPWTDIFAMGAVLYQMISGEKPIDAGARLLATSAGKPDPFVPTKEVGRGKYPEEFLQAVDQALLIDQSKRPRSIEAWLKMMREKPKNVVNHDAETVLIQNNSTDKFSASDDTTVFNSVKDNYGCKKCVLITAALFLLLQPFIIMAYNHFQPAVTANFSSENIEAKKVAPGSSNNLIEKTKQFASEVIHKFDNVVRFKLTVKTTPKNARIRILNIAPQFKQGMALEPDNYRLEISHPGYETKKLWIKMKNRDRVLNIKLTRQTK